MSTYRQFFTTVLEDVKAPVSEANLEALATVSIIEGSNDRFNPLNYVGKYGDSISFNSIGVQDYKTYANGIGGTVEMLKGSPWRGVLAALQRNAGDHTVLEAFATEYGTWGSHPKFFDVTSKSASGLLDKTMPGSSSSSNPKPPTKPVTPPTKPSGKTYKVKRGDTLWGIATKELGSGTKWESIYNANKSVIGSNPDLIKAGQVLSIP